MWAKSLLLSAMLATNAAHAPLAGLAGVGPQVPSAAQMLVPIQDHQGRHGRGNRGDDDQRGSRNDRVQEPRPLREAIEEVSREAGGGELLRAQLEEPGQRFYLIRWRHPDGSVRDHRISAVR